MRQMIAVVGLVVVSGCTEWVSPPAEPPVEPVAGACPEFRTIPGDVTITNTADLDAFVAQGCVAVEGTLMVAETNLTTVNLPGLARAGRLGIVGNPSLVNVHLPALTVVDSSVSVESGIGCGQWGWYDAPSTDLCVGGNPSLLDVQLPALVTVRSMAVVQNALLAGLSLPALREVLLPDGGVCGAMPCHTWGDLKIYLNDQLATVNLPALVTAGVHVGGNLGLLSMTLAALTTCSSFVVQENPLYPQCAAEATLARLSSPPRVTYIAGNDTTVTCRP